MITDQKITRDQLIADLKLRGYTVTAYDLQNWQQKGAIPHGMRCWHNGAMRLLYDPDQVNKIIHYLKLRRLRKTNKDGLIRRILELER